MIRKLVKFDRTEASIKYATRHGCDGPEAHFVQSFLANGLQGKGYSLKFENAAIFLEPRLDSGFPDVVLAEFLPRYYESWNDARNLLTSGDLKLLTYLHAVGGATSNQIRKSTRLNGVSLLSSLEALVDSNLIDRNRTSRMWMPRSVNQTFGIKRLVAIEAKVANNQVVLDQAALNKWFASESYALTPVAPTVDFLSQAQAAGIGVVSVDARLQYRRVMSSCRLRLPSSYASWQFNEWIGRKMY